jgi:hypothetical protein
MAIVSRMNSRFVVVPSRENETTYIYDDMLWHYTLAEVNVSSLLCIDGINDIIF